MIAPQEIIRRPILTEKSTRLRETGGKETYMNQPAEEIAQKVVFEVATSANKIDVRRAVEAMFDVTVTGVTTLVQRGKKKRMGRTIGRRPKTKKAIVTLRAGDSIELFEGV